MLRDEVGGRFVNMVPLPNRQDIYGQVADKATKLITADVGGENDELARAWLAFGLNRSITKRSVMVVPYAGTFHSCMQYTADAVEELLQKGKPNPWPEPAKLSEFTVYGAKKIWEAIGTTVIAAVAAMKWLGQLAEMVSRVPGSTHVEWTTPLNFLVHQSKWNLTSRQVRTWFDGAVLMPRIVEEQDTLAPKQMASSVAPSFVHSLDATHMMMTICNGLDEGLENFAAVHDSFGVHACDMPMFSTCIRNAFHYMYSEHDVLAEFLESAKKLIPEEQWGDIPAMPSKGTLDIDGVLDSQFFFS
jgi:DNA-directed RNA polymerase